MQTFALGKTDRQIQVQTGKGASTSNRDARTDRRMEAVNNCSWYDSVASRVLRESVCAAVDARSNNSNHRINSNHTSNSNYHDCYLGSTITTGRVIRSSNCSLLSPALAFMSQALHRVANFFPARAMAAQGVCSKRLTATEGVARKRALGLPLAHLGSFAAASTSFPPAQRKPRSSDVAGCTSLRKADEGRARTRALPSPPSEPARAVMWIPCAPRKHSALSNSASSSSNNINIIASNSNHKPERNSNNKTTTAWLLAVRARSFLAHMCAVRSPRWIRV